MPLLKDYHGVVTTHDAKTLRLLEIGTKQCPHCNAHFEWGPGRTKGRGWCDNCQAHICGAGCLTCIPYEQRMENLEAGRPELTPRRPMVTGGWAPRQGGKVLVPANSE